MRGLVCSGNFRLIDGMGMIGLLFRTGLPRCARVRIQVEARGMNRFRLCEETSHRDLSILVLLDFTKVAPHPSSTIGTAFME